jgi:lactoylglutathione lyase
MEFYEKALGLKEAKRIEPKTGEFIIVYMGDGYWLEVLPSR